GHSARIMTPTAVRSAAFRPSLPTRAFCDLKRLTGQDEVRVATDDPLVPLVQRTPTAVHLEGVGDGPQAVPAADGVGAVGGVVRGACGMPAGRPRGEVLLLLLGAGATMPA